MVSLGADTQASGEPPRGCVVRLAEPDNPLIERDEASRPQRGTPRDVLSSICVYSQRALSQSSLCRVVSSSWRHPSPHTSAPSSIAPQLWKSESLRQAHGVSPASRGRLGKDAAAGGRRRFFRPEKGRARSVEEGRRAVQGAQWNGSRSEQEAPRSTKWRERRAGARVR